ncbi:ThiF family adenylyltransferase [Duganella fentianensis]|uniref:ThiF family adenylyltransferase n=1 Tax=Duganella fentianensis TaxID=2692177 RepID=UPI0032B1973E
MPANQTAPNHDIQRLLDAEYQVLVDGNHLIVDNIPYISAEMKVCRGALISAYTIIDGVTNTGDHTVWFTGSMPHMADGKSLENAIHAGGAMSSPEIVAGRKVFCRFSNYPDPETQVLMGTDVFVKMTHYIRKLERFVAAIDPSATASGQRSFKENIQPSVFHYPNTSIARAGLDAYECKLAVNKVAIIGLGGTGAYILDALAKTPVAKIHLFDGDVIEPHNAFRLPGAIPGGLVTAGLHKTEYLRDVYHHLRGGVESFPFMIDDNTIQRLDECDFVFIAVDNGPSRGFIANHLMAKEIPFIDVGIGVEKIPEDVKLLGRARVTFVDPHHENAAKALASLPVADDKNDEVYNNIQLVELNAINAMLAIVKYKQYLDFYSEEIPYDSLKYTLSWSQLKAG